MSLLMEDNTLIESELFGILWSWGHEEFLYKFLKKEQETFISHHISSMKVDSVLK